MFFNPKLGMQGNIEEALKRNQQTSNHIFNEEQKYYSYKYQSPFNKL